jgi:hypothetical protein
MKMKTSKFLMVLLLSGIIKVYGQGFASQFVPGLQIGTNKVKYSTGDKYKFGASLALMEFDRVASRLYFNIGMNDGYYRLTSINRQKKMARDSTKYAKNNGQLFGMRLGMVFGKGEFQRIGFSLNGSFSALNGAMSYDPDKVVTYGSVGGGLVYYRKLSKQLHVMAKLGYESLKGKSFTVKGRLLYLETTIAYEFYQRFGVSVQPAFYSRKMDFIDKEHGDINRAGTKISQMVLKVGITKFLR